MAGRPAQGDHARQCCEGSGEGGALGLYELADRAVETGVDQVVGAVHLGGREASAQLVLALGAGFEARLAGADGVLDQLVEAHLEVQRVDVSRSTPVASVQVAAFSNESVAATTSPSARATTMIARSPIASAAPSKNASVR